MRQLPKNPPTSEPGTIWVLTHLSDNDLLELSAFAHWQDVRKRFHDIVRAWLSDPDDGLDGENFGTNPRFAMSLTGHVLRISSVRLL